MSCERVSSTDERANERNGGPWQETPRFGNQRGVVLVQNVKISRAFLSLRTDV